MSIVDLSAVLLHSKVRLGKNCAYKLKGAGIQFITKAERAWKLSLARSIHIFQLVVPGRASTFCGVNPGLCKWDCSELCI